MKLLVPSSFRLAAKNGFTCLDFRSGGFATARHADDTGVASRLLRAVPFLIPPEAAHQAASQASHHHPFLRAAGDPKACKETLLPIWLNSLEVAIKASRAQVGHQVWRYVKRPGAKHAELVQETEWTWRTAHYALELAYRPETDPCMQVVATNKWGSLNLDALRPGPLVIGARPVTEPGLLTNPLTAEQRRVVPYSVSASDARAKSLAFIRKEELKRAELWYQQLFEADLVRSVDLDISVLTQTSFPLYVPVYVYSYEMSRNSAVDQVVAAIKGVRALVPVKVYTLVSGVTMAVASTQVYSEARVGAAVGLVGPIIFMFGGVAWSASKLLMSMVLPGLAAALLARYAPEIRNTVHQLPSATHVVMQVLRQKLGMSAGASSADSDRKRSSCLEDEWVRAYQQQESKSSQSKQSSWQQQQRQQQRQSSRQQQQQQQYQQGWQGSQQSSNRSTSSADHKGYYQQLGVPPTASMEDIQEAFRSLALQHHPDRHTSPQAKAAATQRFQALSQAYTVLRNPAKRSAYDAGMLDL